MAEPLPEKGEELLPTLNLLSAAKSGDRRALESLFARYLPRIRQIVMEVHDLHGALGEVRGLLRGRGFDVVVEQDPLLAGSVLYNLFAIGRSAYGTAAAGPRHPIHRR